MSSNDYNSDGTRTNTKLEQDYNALKDSVVVINEIIAGSRSSNDTTDQKKNRVKINVTHLENSLTLPDWGSEDMTTINKAITDGNAYVG